MDDVNNTIVANKILATVSILQSSYTLRLRTIKIHVFHLEMDNKWIMAMLSQLA